MECRRKILVVDDEPHNIMLLEGILTKLGHEVVGAENAVVALEKLDRTYDLVLSDVMMPVMNGFEFVEKIRENTETQDIPVIMVTTLSQKGDRLKAVEIGANDFITKPIDIVELRVRTESMLRQKAQQDEIKSFESDLNELVESRTLELREALSKLDEAHVETIHHLCAAAEYKDEETADHLVRMAEYSRILAEKSGLDVDTVQLIHTSSPMHDIGKIGIPDSILLKPGKLTAEEWEVMKSHAVIGGNILSMGSSEYINMGSVIALSHHEKWDGSGYPSGLSGEDIPLPGRICAVADVFDALTSKRPYKEPFSVEKSLEIMKEGRGIHFDPKLIDLFFENIEQILYIKESCAD
ncbi:HD-GYP domain-containing protein [Maridesulfovibrio salexigens]|uniref:Response regulator receiver modulated metal dependent phosphohydrolase n=1 Tax=Maridesulfovibrio salexigens (strain ATCC 14822 / DSM 2638 / NCIMB 8403 / VKM B-1763) TaxID=526222 RepID=C6BUQ2_MARSD|nr:HD domain-containing phosphohydrolase [Maridesulfovibrio salexigens]ACS81846.1 response regulator receiver modulated metal dependent phosphohydrolase [Maridesulfovibrio salexigens DSM 2638]